MLLMRVIMSAGLLFGMVSCQSAAPPVAVLSPLPAAPIQIPRDVQRIAVLYPRQSRPELVEAYNRLEGATFRLKWYRPDLKIVERFDLPRVLDEQRLQLTGSVADDSAVRIGRLLGVDSVLIYRIDGPTLRDRVWARNQSDLPPVTVTSKLIRVESAEVVYHNVVSARMDQSSRGGWSLADNMDYQRLTRDAMDRGIAQTLLDLGRALE